MHNMSSSQPNSRSNPHPFINQEEWVLHIANKLEEQSEDANSPITIFNVPRPLKDIHSKSYIPQQVAIGPCHSDLLEIHDMERYKLAAAKRNTKDKLKKLFQIMVKSEAEIRASYQMLFSVSGETLAWMMVLDASFLLEFLLDCNVKEKKATNSAIPSSLSHLASLNLNQATRNAMLRDVSLVDNQIPLFVLKDLLNLYIPSPDADEMLFSMLVGVCEELSPFKMVKSNNDKVNVKDIDHLLNFLYHFVVPKLNDKKGLVEVVEVPELPKNDIKDAQHSVKSAFSHFRGPITMVKKVILCRPVIFIVKLPWRVLSKLLPEENNHDTKDEESTTKGQASPLLEEIEIPSVTQLVGAGVTFQSTNKGISSISFNNETRIFYLPTVNLDVNSTVVLQNLVAYEVCSVSGPLILSRYTELMNGIIDTEEDAKYLREKGIVVNRLKSDEEVANLWNGMSKSIRLTKVPFLDKIIVDVNKDYNMRWIVRFTKCMKSYIYRSWRMLTLFGALLMIFFTGLQAFCSVYNCARIFPIGNLS